jgi:hypothetical protein
MNSAASEQIKHDQGLSSCAMSLAGIGLSSATGSGWLKAPDASHNLEKTLLEIRVKPPNLSIENR